jgi:pimeloyl-ACP methyl ester carboxylesterase
MTMEAGWMGSTRVDTLKVPGASLHYEVQGSGPVLLIIPGMPADAGFYSVLARRLADTFTVVSYDPRGMSRSRLDGPPEDQRVEVHADDAHRILDAVGAGPAYVLGDSISGLVGLHLAASEPGHVRALVAFEPPVSELLPDRERWRAFIEELYDIYRSEGVLPALQKFGEGTGMGGGGEHDESEPQGEPDPDTAAAMARMGENIDFWFAHVMRPTFLGYAPDIARLRAGPTRIVVAVGDASEPRQMMYQTTHALAERLGTSPVAVPGDHGAVTSHPDAFAGMLQKVLCGG